MKLITSRRTKSGYKGVYATSNDKWQARIRQNDEYLYLGIFETKEEAAIAYKRAAGESKEPKLDKTIQVDLLLYPIVNQYRWSIGKGAVASAYVLNKFKSGRVMIHHFVWFLYFGEVVDGRDGFTLDHINGDFRDNRLINLRKADRTLQAFNQKIHSNNTTGFRGVTFNKSQNRYVARICHGGKRKHLGNFKSAEDASQAYEEAFNKLCEKYSYTNLQNRQ